jgi:hypothetical protein
MSSFNATSNKNSGYIYTVPAENTYMNKWFLPICNWTPPYFRIYSEGYNGDAAGDIRKKALLARIWDLGLIWDWLITLKRIFSLQPVFLMSVLLNTVNVETFTYKGYYKYEGINPNFSSTNAPENVYDQFNDAVPLDTVYNGYTTWRPIKMNSSYQYSFNDSREGGDCSCSGRNRNIKCSRSTAVCYDHPRAPIMALTGYYRRNVLDNLQVKATYTVDSYSYKK